MGSQCDSSARPVAAIQPGLEAVPTARAARGGFGSASAGGHSLQGLRLQSVHIKRFKWTCGFEKDYDSLETAQKNRFRFLGTMIFIHT